MIDRPHVAMLALAVLLRISAVAAEPGGTGSTCQGMADDCVEGYTSLLQDSMSIIGHQRETVARQSKAHLQRAKGSDEQEPEPGQGRQGKGAGAEADETKPEPEIVDHKQAPPASVANRTWLQEHGSLLVMGMLAVVGSVFFLRDLREAGFPNPRASQSHSEIGAVFKLVVGAVIKLGGSLVLDCEQPRRCGRECRKDSRSV